MANDRQDTTKIPMPFFCPRTKGKCRTDCALFMEVNQGGVTSWVCADVFTAQILLAILMALQSGQQRGPGLMVPFGRS